MQNLIFKGLNGQFKIVATTQYITRIYDSTNKGYYSITGSCRAIAVKILLLLGSVSLQIFSAVAPLLTKSYFTIL